MRGPRAPSRPTWRSSQPGTTLSCWFWSRPGETTSCQLKDKFEKYKTRAQSILRSRGNKEPDPTSREIKELQTRNNKLQAQVDALQAQCEEGEERQLLLTQKLRMEMRELHDRHRQEVATSLSASQKPAAEFPTAYWSSLFLNESNTVLCGPNPSLKTVRAVVGDYWNRLVDVLK